MQCSWVILNQFANVKTHGDRGKFKERACKKKQQC